MTTDTEPAAQASDGLKMADLLALREKMLAERGESFKVEAQHYMDVMSLWLRMRGRQLPQPEVVGDGADLAALAEWEDDTVGPCEQRYNNSYLRAPLPSPEPETWVLGVGSDGKVNVTWDYKLYRQHMQARWGTHETE